MKQVELVIVITDMLIMSHCQEAEVRGEKIVDCQAEART